jgi:hypothetical protein
MSFFGDGFTFGNTKINLGQFLTFDFLVSSAIAVSTLLSLPLVSLEPKDDFEVKEVIGI